MEAAKKLIAEAGMDPSKFCVIRNQCFLHDDVQGQGQGQGQGGGYDSSKSRSVSRTLVPQLKLQTQTPAPAPAQALGAATPKSNEQSSALYSILHATEIVTGELADWFEDPTILSDWLVSQQVKMTPEQTMVL